MDIGQKIRALRQDRKLTQQELAKLVGVTDKAVSTWENGTKTPRMGVIEKLADYFGVSKAYLVDDNITFSSLLPEDIQKIDGIVPVPHGKSVPVIGSIACGTPVLAVENIDGYIEVNPQDPADFALICKGSSMRPRLIDGDVVLIHQQPTVDNGQTAAVLIGEEATLKRVYFPDREHIILSPENPDFSPMSFAKEELNNIKILGKVVGFVRYF